MDAPGQRSFCLVLQTFLDQELPNYTLTMSTDGSVYQQKSSVIEIPISHPTSEKQSQSWGSSKTCPLHFTCKQMDYPNKRINGWNNTCILSLPCIPKTGPTGFWLHQQCTTIRLTQPLAYHPIRSFLDTVHASLHQKQSKWTMRQQRNE